MRNVVFYHDNCLDGFASAFAAYMHLGDNDTIYVPIQYGSSNETLDALIGVDGNDVMSRRWVMFADFCPKGDIIDFLIAKGHSVTIIDHHKTAPEYLSESDAFNHKNSRLDTRISMKNSGCVLVWDYFTDKKIPEIFKLIEDRDLWQFKYEKTKAFCEYLWYLERDFSVWAKEIKPSGGVKDEHVDLGENCLKLKQARVEAVCNNAYISDIRGYNVPTVNATSDPSEVAHELIKRNPDSLFVAVWYQVDGTTKRYSLRSGPNGIDCTLIAKYFGGGGHYHAAGFTIR